MTAATGGWGAGSRRCDLTQRKIHAVYEHGAAGNVQREGCSPGLEQHRGTQTALGADEDVRKVSTGLLHKRELQWILGQWQKGQNVHSQVVERSGQAWVEWQLEMEDMRVSEARQRQIVEVTELATQLERYQIRVNVEEQRWVEEQIEGQGVEQRTQAQQERVLAEYRARVEGVDDSALGTDVTEMRRRKRGGKM